MTAKQPIKGKSGIFEKPTIFRPGIQPQEEPQLSFFDTIRQGTATNTLTKLRADTLHTEINKITGTAIITQGDFTITIPNYTKLAGLKTSTYQLLDTFTIILTESGAASPTVELSLAEYMDKRGLKDRKEARKQLTADLDILLKTSIAWTETKSGEAYAGINITDSWVWANPKKTVIQYSFTNSFFNILLGYPVMAYPTLLQRLNNRKNPNSYYLLRKISELKNMNAGKQNEDIISVKTLLENAPYIPSYEEVMNGNRNLTDRIVKPFERDMNALEEALTWHYCYSKGETDEEIEETPDYSSFITYNVKISWRTYPDQTARLERKAERIEQAKARKEKREIAKAKAKGKEEARLEAEQKKKESE